MEETLPGIRPDLKIFSWTRPVASRQRHFASEPQTGNVLELGAEAAFLCRRLDGRSSMADLRRDYERQFGKPLLQEDLDVLIQQLAAAGFLDGIPARERRRTLPEIFSFKVLKDLVPWKQIPLGEGDLFAARLSRWLGWAFTRPFHVAALAVLLWAVTVTYSGWSDYWLAIERQFSWSFVVINLLISAIVVRSARALVHGAACKRHRQFVTEMGLALSLYIIPSFYVDWSDVVYLRNKKERDWVILSGLYFHLLLWAVAMIAWRLTAAGGTPNTAFLMVSFVAGFTFLAVAVNPIAEGDGYFLLVNWLEIEELRERSLASFGSWIQLRLPPEVLSPRHRRWFPIYGLVCFLYAVVLTGWFGWFLWSRLTAEYRGIGALGVLAFATFVAHKPMVDSIGRRRSVKWLFRKDGSALRWSVRLGIVAVVVLIGFIPYPYETGGPFTLLPVQQTEVHTQVEGEVIKVMIHEGDLVKIGQPIAVMDPREYERNYAATAEQLAAAQAKLDLALAGPKLESVATAESELQKANQEVEQARVKSASSTARAKRYDKAFADHLVAAQEYENVLAAADNDRQGLEVALKEQIVARAQLDLTKSGTRPEELDALKAEVQTLQTMWNDLRKQIELTTLTAPVAGRVITPYVDQKVHHYLKTGDLFAKIEESATIRAEVEVPEEDAPDVKQGSLVRVVPWAFPSEVFYGTVVEVAPAANEKQQLTVVRVLSEFPNNDGRLKSNLTGYAKIATHNKPVWKVLLWPLIRWVMVEVWSWIP
ncbi:MAG TPA: PqqD family peptide modification chaperone [Patescibacteria group bacterium]|nr:PqqD family peptide modification chaperone [Patescibacteria group bacterium]